MSIVMVMKTIKSVIVLIKLHVCDKQNPASPRMSCHIELSVINFISYFTRHSQAFIWLEVEY